jgi:hypothetical protein
MIVEKNGTVSTSPYGTPESTVASFDSFRTDVTGSLTWPALVLIMPSTLRDNIEH